MPVASIDRPSLGGGRRVVLWLVRLMAIGAAVVAVAGAVSAARGGTLTLMHVTDSSGAVLTEAARYHGTEGVVRGTVTALCLLAAGAALGWRRPWRAIAGLALSGYWLWLLWKAVAFAYYDVPGTWPWGWAMVGLVGAALVATAWVGSRK